ncbi:MAG: glycoside hydrolase family 3 C-terminal domain-containing protein [Bacteroidales bacterium]|jgi:beta-glucosidase|nr:glycoside hydrolase family 3 C-terminal domain-containing protein [Bacteroidales bacterium]
MKKTIIMICAAGAVLCGCSQKDPQLGKASVDKVVKAMTLEEKAMLVIGTGMQTPDNGANAVVGNSADLVPGAAGSTRAIPRLGIPAIVLADGPAGLRINPTREGDDATYYCTHFPIGTLLASTWNQELVESVGESMGEEVHEYGVDVYLAPAMNIHRNPLNGRNFEYYSEDPVVAGKTAAAYVRGVQKNDVGTSVKHFAYNNQETNRTANDARISPRAQREIYLKGFEIVVKESDPWTIMTSYNKLNGTYTSQRRDLVTTVLRDEWGFKGTVMTDWYGGDDAAAQMHAGNDMIQPGRQSQYEQIIDGVKNGTLDEADLDVCVKRILNLVLRSPRFKGYAFTNKPDLTAHAAVTRQSALEGMVLLENKNATLPIKDAKKVALFGCTSYDFIAGGTGSGNVNRAYTVSLLDGLKNGGFNVDESFKDIYTKYIADETAKALKANEGDPLAAFLPVARPTEYIPSSAQIASAVRNNDIAIITYGRNSGEFLDRTPSDFELSAQEKTLLKNVSDAFHRAGKKVIVVLNVGGVIETASWKNIPDAILLAWQAGQEGGNSVTDILTGKQSPSGKLSMTFPVNLMDHASSANFPMGGDTKVYFTERRVDTGEKDVDYTNYEEGIYVGYRWFDKQNMAVSYPFGYGLSYTTFGYSDPKVSNDGTTITANVTVKNTGSVAGKEVVELYVTAPASSLDKPVKELKAYAKTKALEPGEEQTLTMTFATADLASFDESKSAWVVDAGTYKFLFGASSRDIRGEATAEVAAQETKVNDVLK